MVVVFRVVSQVKEGLTFYKIDEIECINSMHYEESVWIKIGRRESLFVGFVYTATESSSVSALDSCYELLKERV